MKYLLKDIIGLMDFRELVKLRGDIEGGSVYLRQLVEENIREKKEKHNKFCITCGNRINPYLPSNFTLLIGPEDDQRKASFCALDCIQYFLEHTNQRVQEEEVQDYGKQR
ncbi:hypothetical protein HY491_02730 [Candidatus Woesearchaeota archaeon]|nr:hypothetical protein [Candidatus Woesearchaeota archaeon]